MRLARPQVDQLRVAGLARGGADRRGDVVDLGVGERRVGVLVHEAVADAAREPAAERARERGRRVGGERVAVRLRGAGLGRAQERGADLGRARAEGERRAHGAPRWRSPPRPPTADVGGGAGRRVRAISWRRACRPIGVRSGVSTHEPRWPPASRALHHERVDVRRRARLLGAGHGHPRLRSRRPHARDHVLVRQPERERDDRDRRALQQRELRLPVVVVEPRRAHRQALGLEPRHVAREHVGRRRRPGHEQVHAERPRRQLPRARDPLAQRVRAQVARGQEAQPAGVGHRGRQLRRGGPAGERRQDDRDRECVEHHRFIVVSRHLDCHKRVTISAAPADEGCLSSPGFSSPGSP